MDESLVSVTRHSNGQSNTLFSRCNYSRMETKMKALRQFVAGVAVLVLSLTCVLMPGLRFSSAQAASDNIAQGYEATIKAAREAVAKQLDSGIPSSATAAVMVDGKIVYAEGFGLRDRSQSLPVDTQTQFNMGSISKIFTAASILVLAQEGLLSLDKPVTDYLPDFSMNDARYKDITVRMLINHTSGFQGTNAKDGFTSVKNRNYVAETLERLKTGSLMNDPGQISVYCNDGFTVAEAVIECVSGKSFAEFLQEKVFDRLGFENTSAYYREGNQNIARVYGGDGLVPLPVEYVNILGSGGLSSTAIDLCRFGEILQSEAVLNQAMLDEYTKAQYGPLTVPAGEPLFNVGLGWDYIQVHQFKSQGINVMAKNGGTLQYFSQLYVLPKEHISIAVIFAGSANPAAVTDAILWALLEEKGIAQKPTPAAPPEDARVPDSMKGFEGYYASGNGIAKVEILGGQTGISLSTWNGERFKPHAVWGYKSDGRFYSLNGGSYSFSEYEGGRVMMVHPDRSDAGYVTHEKLSSGSSADTAAFSGKVWVPVNMSPYDFPAGMIQTAAIPEVPGYILVNDGETFTPLALKSPTDTWLSFHYLRDQPEFHMLTVQGETLLYNYGYLYADASTLPTAAMGDTLQIDPDGGNKACRIAADAFIRFSIPDGGRVVVFDPGLSLLYDSLKTDSQEVHAQAGSYILAIGEPGDTFELIPVE